MKHMVRSICILFEITSYTNVCILKLILIPIMKHVMVSEKDGKQDAIKNKIFTYFYLSHFKSFLE